MFGLFKRKPKNALEALIVNVYGSLDHKKTANLTDAIELAHVNLLGEQVERKLVEAKAAALNDGPMPYSTRDLALATALGFYKDDAWHDALKDVQMFARLQLIDWLETGGVAKPLAATFENTLYTRFKPGV